MCRKWMSAVLLAVFMVGCNVVFAQVDLSGVTRWIGPRPKTVELFQSNELVRRSTAQDQLGAALLAAPVPGFTFMEVIPGFSVGRMAVVVDGTIYDAVMSQYRPYFGETFSKDGLTKLVYRYDSGGPWELRQLIQELFTEPDGLEAALLIGNVPYFVFQLAHQNFGPGMEDYYEEFPTDLPLMSICQTCAWEDVGWNGTTAGDGKLDRWTDPRMNSVGVGQVDIWVSRLPVQQFVPEAGNITQVIAKPVDNYYQFRLDKETLDSLRVLIPYADNNAPCDSAEAALFGVLADCETDYNDPSGNSATSAGYLQELQKPYVYVVEWSHGNPSGHGFIRDYGNVLDFITPSQYSGSNAKFVSMASCSVGAWNWHNFVGGAPVFYGEGVGVMSSTKTWGGYGYWLSKYLSDGLSMGSALKSWFNDVNRYSNPSWQWVAGVMSIGDPEVRVFSQVTPPPPPPPAPLVTISASRSNVTQGESLSLSWVPSNVSSCQASGAWNGAKNPAGGSEVVGSLTVLGTNTFSIECWNTQNVSTGVKSVVVIVEPVLPSLGANFSLSVTRGKSPLRVAFQDQSSSVNDPIVKWFWEYGDGRTSTRRNTTYMYRKAGVYTVRLTVTTQSGQTSTKEFAGVYVYTAPRANFLYLPRAGTAPLSINFNDRSSGTVLGWQWEFSDGSVSNERNPIHTFATKGTYSVRLTVFGPDGLISSRTSRIRIR